MAQMENDPLAELKKAVISQKTAALPDVPPDPALMQLHDSMVAYDRHVSQVVIDLLGGGHEAPEFGQRAEIDLLFAEADPTHHTPLIEQYRRYQERLDRMMSLSRQIASDRST
ncbi:MAG TPA: hypothetical protein VHO48_06955 [Anaerolineaceae bacterium]|nr:hypothetical protein [Anaerolineaceae bacterium]